MSEPKPKPHHSRFAKILLVSHVSYYGATAFGIHLAHSVAAGIVGMLILIAYFAGWEME